MFAILVMSGVLSYARGGAGHTVFLPTNVCYAQSKYPGYATHSPYIELFTPFTRRMSSVLPILLLGQIAVESTNVGWSPSPPLD